MPQGEEEEVAQEAEKNQVCRLWWMPKEGFKKEWESRKFAGRPNCRRTERQSNYQPGEDPCGSGESESTPKGLLLPAPSHAGDCIPGTDSEDRPLNASEDAADTAGSPGHRPAQRHTDLGSCERPRRFWGMGKRRDRTSLTPTEWREGTLPLPESSLPGPAFPNHPHLTLRCPWRVSAAAREPQVHFLRPPWEGLGSPQAPGAESAATPRIPAAQGPAPESPPRLPCAPLDGGWWVPRRKSKSLRRPEAVGLEHLPHPGNGARAPPAPKPGSWSGFGMSQAGSSSLPRRGFC